MYSSGNTYLSSLSQHKTTYANLGNKIAGVDSKIPQHKYDLWYNYLTKRGVKFEIATTEANKILLDNNAKGLFVRKCINIENNIWERTIYLGKDFEAHTFYEETLHALDSIKGRPGKMLYNGEFIDAYEFRAKSILMNSSENRGFSYEQFIELEHHLELVKLNKY